MDARADENIISKVYYNTTSGFGSIDESVRQVKQIDKSIKKAESSNSCTIKRLGRQRSQEDTIASYQRDLWSKYR